MKVKIWYMCKILKDMTLLLKGNLHCASWCWCLVKLATAALADQGSCQVLGVLMLYMFVHN